MWEDRPGNTTAGFFSERVMAGDCDAFTHAANRAAAISRRPSHLSPGLSKHQIRRRDIPLSSVAEHEKLPMTRPSVPPATSSHREDLTVFRPMITENRLDLTVGSSLSHRCHKTTRRYLGCTSMGLPFDFEGSRPSLGVEADGDGRFGKGQGSARPLRRCRIAQSRRTRIHTRDVWTRCGFDAFSNPLRMRGRLLTSRLRDCGCGTGGAIPGRRFAEGPSVEWLLTPGPTMSERGCLMEKAKCDTSGRPPRRGRQS